MTLALNLLAFVALVVLIHIGTLFVLRTYYPPRRVQAPDLRLALQDDHGAEPSAEPAAGPASASEPASAAESSAEPAPASAVEHLAGGLAIAA